MKPGRKTPYGTLRPFWELSMEVDVEDGAKAAMGIPRKYYRSYLDQIEPKNAEQFDLINAMNVMIMASRPYPFLVVSGGNGTGKSLIGAAAVNLAGRYEGTVDRDTGAAFSLEAKYVNEADLLNRVESYNSRTDWFGMYTDECRLLVIDEVGLTQWTATDKRKMEQLLNKRFANDFRTVLLTNLGIGQLFEIFSSQLRSRFATGAVIQLTGPDLRVYEKDDLTRKRAWYEDED